MREDISEIGYFPPFDRRIRSSHILWNLVGRFTYNLKVPYDGINPQPVPDEFIKGAIADVIPDVVGGFKDVLKIEPVASTHRLLREGYLLLTEVSGPGLLRGRYSARKGPGEKT